MKTARVAHRFFICIAISVTDSLKGVHMYSFNHKPTKQRPPKAATRRPDNGDPVQQSDDLYFLLPGVLAVVIVMRLLIAASGSNAVAQVGDILDFHGVNASVVAATTAVPARLVAGPWASPGHSCALNVSTMTNPGGAMTVMAVRADGVLLSWAGGATAKGNADCGSSQQILVTAPDYGRLQMALRPKPYRR
jgi:hypothetical protein